MSIGVVGSEFDGVGGNASDMFSGIRNDLCTDRVGNGSGGNATVDANASWGVAGGDGRIF